MHRRDYGSMPLQEIQRGLELGSCFGRKTGHDVHVVSQSNRVGRLKNFFDFRHACAFIHQVENPLGAAFDAPE